MQKDKIVVGLDIGSTKICALVGRQDEYGKIEILGMGKAESHGVIRGIVTNIDKTVQAIQEAIKQAEEQAEIDIKVVNVGIAGQHIKSMVQRTSIIRNSNEDEITYNDVNRLTNDVYKMVVPPGTQILHVMPQDYTIDSESGIKEPIGMSGIRLEANFNVIIAQTSAIHNINRCVKRCQLEIEELILEPIASSMAVLTEEEREAGIVLVDIGGGTTDIAIFYENIMRHTAVIPLAGNIITTDIKECCKIMDSQAEKLKIKYGSAIADAISDKEFVSIPGLKGRPSKEVSLKMVAQVIEARMQEIIELVHNEIIKSGYMNKLVGGIVVTGGGSQLRNCKELFQMMTGMDTRIGHPNEYLGKSKVEIAKSPMYATTVGLVIAGFRALDDRENRYLQERAHTGKAIKSKSNTTNFFQQIIAKTKSLLIDDFDGKNQY